MRDAFINQSSAPPLAPHELALQGALPTPHTRRTGATIQRSKRAWVVPGIGTGWLCWLAQGEREAREAEAAAAAEGGGGGGGGGGRGVPLGGLGVARDGKTKASSTHS